MTGFTEVIDIESASLYPIYHPVIIELMAAFILIIRIYKQTETSW